MASLLLASPSSLSLQFHTSSSHSNSNLSYSHSQSLFSPLFTSFPTVSISSTKSPSVTLAVTCGRGDRKTAKGKRFNHSFGNSRPRNKNRGTGPPRIYTPPDPTKKDKFEDNEFVHIELDDFK